LGTRVRVTNLANRRSTILVVEDRGPFIRGRIIDVSTQAADVLGFRRAGVVQVAVEAVSN
jgi:rare lipoprotein A